MDCWAAGAGAAGHRHSGASCAVACVCGWLQLHLGRSAPSRCAKRRLHCPCRLAARVPARDDTAASPVKAGSEVPLDEASKKILRFIQRAERPAAAAGPARASAASRGGDGALPGSESFSMAGLVGSEGSCFSFAPLLRDSQVRMVAHLSPVKVRRPVSSPCPVSNPTPPGPRSCPSWASTRRAPPGSARA